MASMTLNGRSDDHPRTLAFTCGRCGQGYGDALYRAPEGHGPANVCLDCWAAEWETRRGLGWERLDIAMYMYAIGGYSQTEVAKAVGTSPRTLRRWLSVLRTDSEKCLATVAEIASAVSKYDRTTE